MNENDYNRGYRAGRADAFRRINKNATGCLWS
jgi:hypothetical protein